MFQVFTKFLLKFLGFYPSNFIVKSQILHVLFGVITCIAYNIYHYGIISPNSAKFDIYFIVELISKEMLILIQIFIFIRNYYLNSHQFFEILSEYFKYKLSEKSQKRLQTVMSIIIFCIALKLMMKFTGSFPRGIFFILSTTTAELTLFMSDFLFILLLENLLEKLKKLRREIEYGNNLQIIDKKLLRHLEVERIVFSRFSQELFITISFNYFKLIVCLYWIFIRIRFKRFTKMEGIVLDNLIRVCPILKDCNFILRFCRFSLSSAINYMSLLGV